MLIDRRNLDMTPIFLKFTNQMSALRVRIALTGTLGYFLTWSRRSMPLMVVLSIIAPSLQDTMIWKGLRMVF